MKLLEDPFWFTTIIWKNQQVSLKVDIENSRIYLDIQALLTNKDINDFLNNAEKCQKMPEESQISTIVYICILLDFCAIM